MILKLKNHKQTVNIFLIVILYLSVTLVSKGYGPFVNPISGSRDGGESPTCENLKFLKILTKKRKFSILASDSPRHFRLPIPKGLSIS